MATRLPNPTGTLPAHGKKIWEAVYASALKGSSARAKAAASRQAWCAVKRQYFKRGSKWVKRKAPLGRGEQPPGCKRRRRNPMLERSKREALARKLGGGLRADATVDDLLAYMRSIESSGRIAYDDDLEDDPNTPKPDLEDLWDELWTNYGDDTARNPAGHPEIHWNELAGFDPPLFESDPIEVEHRGLGVFRLRAATHYVRNRLKQIKYGKHLGYDSTFIEVLEVGVPGRHKWGDAQRVTAGPLVLADAKRAVDLWREDKPFTSDNGRIADVYPKGYSTPRNPHDVEDDFDRGVDEGIEIVEDVEEDLDEYGRRISEYEQHMAESDLVPNPEIWVVVAPENRQQWPIAPAAVVSRDEALRLPGLGGPGGPGVQRWLALRTGFRSEGQARSYADKVEHTMIEVSRPSDGTVVYRGSLLGFSEDPASSSLKYVDRGRLVGLADSQVETKLGQGKKALVARRDRSGNPREKNPNTKANERIVLSNGDVMTLAEAIDAGRVELREMINGKTGKPSYTAWEAPGFEIGWGVNKTLYESRMGMPISAGSARRDRSSNPAEPQRQRNPGRQASMSRRITGA